MGDVAIDVDAVIQRITGEIHRLEAEAGQNLSVVLRYKAEIGKRLLAARAAFRQRKGWRGKNEWEEWGEKEFQYSSRVMDRTIWLWRNAPKLADLGPMRTFEAAMAALKEPKALAAPAEEQPADGTVLYRLTGEVRWLEEAVHCMGDPDVTVLVAACQDWKVRRG